MTDAALEIGMVRQPVQWVRWPEARALLDPALQRGDEDWQTVERDLSTNAEQLWVVLRGDDLLAAAVTRVAISRGDQIAEVYLVGGRDAPAWLGALSATIEESARDLGCTAMRACGRSGWRRPLGALGWDVRAVVYERDLP